MFAFTNAKNKTSPTIIGAGAEFTGDIISDTMVQVHGIVRGKIKADTVIIGRGGKVVGRVSAKNFVLHGELDGPASADVANVMPEARVSGTLTYSRLNAMNCAQLECKLICKKKGDADE